MGIGSPNRANFLDILVISGWDVVCRADEFEEMHCLLVKKRFLRTLSDLPNKISLTIRYKIFVNNR